MPVEKTVPRPPSLLLLIAYAAFVTLGLPDGLLGVAWPSIHRTLGIPVSGLGILLVAASAGFQLSSFSNGQIVSRIGIGWLLVVSSLLVASSLFGFALFPVLWLLAGCAVLLGMGGGAIDAGLNGYAASHFSTRHVNWLHACYGLGAMLGPLIMTTLLSRSLPWQWGYVLVGVILAAMAATFVLTRRLWNSRVASTDTVSSAPLPALGMRAALKQPLVWLGILIFFVYTGLEVTAGLWAYTLFTEERGIPPGVAGIWISVYWGSLTAGRLVFGLITERFGQRTVLRVSMVSVLVGAVLIWLPALPLFSFLGLTLIGFMLAPIFPLLIAQTPARLGAGTATHAIGFQVAAANLGSALVPAFAGILAQSMGLEIIGPFLLLTALLMLLLYELLPDRAQTKERAEPETTQKSDPDHSTPRSSSDI